MTDNKGYDSKKLANVQAQSQYPLLKEIHFDTIGSTNTWAKENWDQWAESGITLITASAQTAGRGRFKRRWESPSDVNIYATFCIWLNPTELPRVGHIPQVLALAAAKALQNLKLTPQLKWPNDVLLSGKKVGGILCETISEREHCGVVCGIGMNINMTHEDLSQIDRPAASLFSERNVQFNVKEVLELLKDYFNEMFNLFMREGFAPFFYEFEALSMHKRGQTVRFHDNQKLIEARFEKINRDGSVELLLSDESMKIFHAGEFVD